MATRAQQTKVARSTRRAWPSGFARQSNLTCLRNSIRRLPGRSRTRGGGRLNCGIWRKNERKLDQVEPGPERCARALRAPAGQPKADRSERCRPLFAFLVFFIKKFSPANIGPTSCRRKNSPIFAKNLAANPIRTGAALVVVRVSNRYRSARARDAG